MTNWDDNIINLLEDVRANSVLLSEYHRKNFHNFKWLSNYFDIPVIIISAFSSSFAVGSQAYLKQELISLIGCMTGFMITIITSVKLYLNIADAMQLELAMSKDFYSLSIDINRILNLQAIHRGEDGIAYLNKKYNTYSKLVESSNLLRKRFKNDRLVGIELRSIGDGSDVSSNPPSPLAIEIPPSVNV
tara:strand:- start:704 stop:1270 length:567 start_codon:yes stop_codon:yes gene_type:complete